MKVDVIRIGNSHGIRIPKPLLEQCGLQGSAEMIVEDGKLVITPSQSLREGWDGAFRQMAEVGDDADLMGDAAPSDWDETDWQW